MLTDSEEHPQGTVTGSICWSCIHLDKTNPTRCEAFPGGIPIMIMLGAFRHTTEYDLDGLNDQGITYEADPEVLKNAGQSG